ncbi:DoxX family protein [Dyadobacter tibetensis]|uniref:DoxX family protein n=1 Tax=Dyadobacter tibetensis TaxID=1211851 RepID=UPI000471E67B|nr:DoxX family protein [Dyadobacter tibetensis]
MNKSKTIIYWITTIFLSVGMLAGGVQQMLQIGGYNEIVSKLGYPLYMLSILGTWKILGVITILLPRLTLLKEWAYAGFCFAMSGAAISHFAAGQALTDALPSLILLFTTILSWYLRPEARKIYTGYNPI